MLASRRRLLGSGSESRIVERLGVWLWLQVVVVTGMVGMVVMMALDEAEAARMARRAAGDCWGDMVV